jgi:hypothetical protein
LVRGLGLFHIEGLPPDERGVAAYLTMSSARAFYLDRPGNRGYIDAASQCARSRRRVGGAEQTVTPAVARRRA